MKCEECLKVIEDYYDGELSEQLNALVAQHVDACAACGAAYRKMEREQELYLSYECDAQPAPAFWDEVMTRATREEPTRAVPSSPALSRLRDWLGNLRGAFSAPRFSPSLTALIVLAAIGLTIFVMSRVNRREQIVEGDNSSQLAENRAAAPTAAPEVKTNSSNSHDEIVRETRENGASPKEKKPPAVQSKGGLKNNSLVATAREEERRNERKPLVPEATADALVREAEQKYVAAIALLSRDVSRRRSQLDPEMTARFNRTLAAIDRTILDTRRAAREHPGDPVAAQYMLTAYAKKVDVLREMVGY